MDTWRYRGCSAMTRTEAKNEKAAEEPDLGAPGVRLASELGRKRQEDIREFEAILGYMESSKLARTT